MPRRACYGNDACATSSPNKLCGAVPSLFVQAVMMFQGIERAPQPGRRIAAQSSNPQDVLETHGRTIVHCRARCNTRRPCVFNQESNTMFKLHPQVSI